jgi:cyanophycin synthetase
MASRQQLLLMQLGYAPVSVDLEQLDALLQTTFELEPAYAPVPERIKLHHDMYRLVQRVLALTAAIARGVQIPCFDTPHIESITSHLDARGAQYRVEVLFPWVDQLSPSLLYKAHEMAFRFVQVLHKCAYDQSRLSPLLDEFDGKFLEPLKLLVPGSLSTVPVLRGAWQKNIPFLHLGGGIYQLGQGSKSILVNRSTTSFDSAIGSQAGQNKLLAAQLLRAAGIPVPKHVRVDSADKAVEVAKTFGFPVVVKPADADRGEGVTVNVETEDAVREAYALAAKRSKQVLVERTIPGICCRIVVVGDKVVYAMKRLPRSVEGDGKHCVQVLAERANAEQQVKAKHLRRKPFPTDELAADILQSRGLDFDYVPAKGELVALRPIESTAWGGNAEVLTETMHPANLAIAIRAAQLMRLTVCGVDLISDDPSKPWYENGAAINEVNFAPTLSGVLDYQKAGIAALLEEVVPGAGRIPIHVFVGDVQAWEEAKIQQRALIDQGLRSVAVSHDAIEDTADRSMAVAPNSLFQRVRASVLDQTVDALVLAVQTDEFLHTGLPLDRIDTLTLVNADLLSFQGMRQLVSDKPVDELLALLKTQLQDDSRAVLY